MIEYKDPEGNVTGTGRVRFRGLTWAAALFMMFVVVVLAVAYPWLLLVYAAVIAFAVWGNTGARRRR